MDVVSGTVARIKLWGTLKLKDRTRKKETKKWSKGLEVKMEAKNISVVLVQM